jgi:hypothetical protein
MSISSKIKHANYYKYQGIAPEGFLLIPLGVIEKLQDFDEWKEFKSDPHGWIESKSKEELADKLNDPQ